MLVNRRRHVTGVHWGIIPCMKLLCRPILPMIHVCSALFNMQNKIHGLIASLYAAIRTYKLAYTLYAVAKSGDKIKTICSAKAKALYMEHLNLHGAEVPKLHPFCHPWQHDAYSHPLASQLHVCMVVVVV